MALMNDAPRIKGWQCIGCGKVEAPQPCIGVCQDRPVELVDAANYDQAVERMRALEALLGKVVRITPRDGEWERAYRMLQQQAREALGKAAR
ncbi:MAG: hypothetical protein KUL75_01365 [Sterolibacterium sp.]|nr:hypothetical protein [Sterolibacterium sp.]